MLWESIDEKVKTALGVQPFMMNEYLLIRDATSVFELLNKCFVCNLHANTLQCIMGKQTHQQSVQWYWSPFTTVTPSLRSNLKLW